MLAISSSLLFLAVAAITIAVCSGALSESRSRKVSVLLIAGTMAVDLALILRVIFYAMRLHSGPVGGNDGFRIVMNGAIAVLVTVLLVSRIRMERQLWKAQGAGRGRNRMLPPS